MVLFIFCFRMDSTSFRVKAPFFDMQSSWKAKRMVSVLEVRLACLHSLLNHFGLRPIIIIIP
jgi:hypothetical protein